MAAAVGSELDHESARWNDRHERFGLRASYAFTTKQATLILLFVKTVWVELWGKDCADREVVVESGPVGLRITPKHGKRFWRSPPSSGQRDSARFLLSASVEDRRLMRR
jgi:hypothetical protein